MTSCSHELSLHAANRTAQRAADRADAIIRSHFRRAPETWAKTVGDEHGSVYDPVTVADHAAEQAIRAVIAADWPDHAITGEEFAPISATSTSDGCTWEWIIDPIDGTRGFLAGTPLFGTLIGLCRRNGESRMPAYGLMSQPVTRERFWSSLEGSRHAGPQGTASLATRSCPALADAILATTDPDLFTRPADRAAFERVKTTARFTRYSADCYAYAQLAAGNIDIVVEIGLKIYDIAALIPIIEAAGGLVTDWSGRPLASEPGGFDEAGRVLATGDAKLHAQAITLLAG